jgi:hypothetical protein
MDVRLHLSASSPKTTTLIAFIAACIPVPRRAGFEPKRVFRILIEMSDHTLSDTAWLGSIPRRLCSFED